MSKYLEDKVFALADTLQMELQIFRTGKTPEIFGGRVFKFPLSTRVGDGSDLFVPAKVVASYLSDTESAVLVHIKRDFYIYLSLVRNGGKNVKTMLTLDFIDAAQMTERQWWVKVNNKRPIDALDYLASAVKATFQKYSTDIVWEQVYGAVGGKVRGEVDTLACEGQKPEQEPKHTSATAA